jgi:hypothetical protein
VWLALKLEAMGADFDVVGFRTGAVDDVLDAVGFGAKTMSAGLDVVDLETEAVGAGLVVIGSSVKFNAFLIVEVLEHSDGTELGMVAWLS